MIYTAEPHDEYTNKLYNYYHQVCMIQVRLLTYVFFFTLPVYCKCHAKYPHIKRAWAVTVSV